MGPAPLADGATWAVIACTSQYFHNYRHHANALSVYHDVRRLGLPDSRIVLMLGGDVPCDSRNAAPGSIFTNRARRLDLYGNDVQVDYRGADVTVESFIAVLTDRLPAGTPSSRRLRSGGRDRVLIYLAGHGGEEFLKFRDHHEMTSSELSGALHQMGATRRAGQLMLIIDTCQAATIFQPIATAAAAGDTVAAGGVVGVESVSVPSLPPTVSLASSALGENSYALEVDPALGVAVSDRFTYFLHNFLATASPPDVPAPLPPLRELFRYVRRAPLHSTAVLADAHWNGSLGDVSLGAFWGMASPPLSVAAPLDDEAAHSSMRRLGAACKPSQPAYPRVREDRRSSVAVAPAGPDPGSADSSLTRWRRSERASFWSHRDANDAPRAAGDIWAAGHLGIAISDMPALSLAAGAVLLLVVCATAWLERCEPRAAGRGRHLLWILDR